MAGFTCSETLPKLLQWKDWVEAKAAKGAGVAEWDVPKSSAENQKKCDINKSKTIEKQNTKYICLSSFWVWGGGAEYFALFLLQGTDELKGEDIADGSQTEVLGSIEVVFGKRRLRGWWQSQLSSTLTFPNQATKAKYNSLALKAP